MIWLVMILSGLANFAARYSMFSGLNFLRVPTWLEEYVKFAPTAALSAIVAASLFVDETGVPFEGSSSKIYAALIACCIALLTRSILFTIFVGLTALWALS